MLKKYLNVITIVLVCIFIMTGCTKKYGLNEPVKINEEDVTITVVSSEVVTINEELSLANGEYIKVKVKVTNNGKNEYSWNNLWNYNLGTETAAFTSEGDELSNTVAPGTTEEGYIYFNKNNSKELIYNTNAKANSKDDSIYTKYVFNLK